MPLAPPPAALGGFPSRRPGASLRRLFRSCWHRDRVTGAVNSSPWRFGAIPPGAGRFDLPTPDGTCYWSDRRYGAWLEVWRGASTIDLVDARARRLWTAQAPPLRLADLLSPRSYHYGITADISTQPEHALPQQWAAALHGVGFAGLVGSCSHDPASAALNVAVFGQEGTPAAQPDWATTSGRIEHDTALLAELASFGVHLAPVPYDVPTIAPNF
jgi:hypothetical protein